MHKVIFTGPTLNPIEISELNLAKELIYLKCVSDITELDLKPDSLVVLPPVSGGDIFELVNLNSQLVIGIIDGYFENRISVWHKEILFALSQNIGILGAASMGALRASELDVFGMFGIGEIYKAFKNGILQDDDEVTIAHGPEQLGYSQLSEAMVNIRWTLAKALEDKILSKNVYDIFLSEAKSLFYKKRNYGFIIRQCIENSGCNEKDFARFQIWLQKYRIDQKKIDAIELVNSIVGFDTKNPDISLPQFEFEDTVLWRNSING